MRPFFVICLSLLTLVGMRALARTSDAPAIAISAPVAAGVKTSATNQVVKSAEPFPVTAVVSSNTVTFPLLLSRMPAPLMTNAVYHRTFGRKVIFGSDLSVQAFDVDQLHPSVLAQLDLDPDRLKADQLVLDQQYQQWAARFRQQLTQLLSTSPANAPAIPINDSSATSTNSSTNTNSPAHHGHYGGYHHVSAHINTQKNPPRP